MLYGNSSGNAWRQVLSYFDGLCYIPSPDNSLQDRFHYSQVHVTTIFGGKAKFLLTNKLPQGLTSLSTIHSLISLENT